MNKMKLTGSGNEEGRFFYIFDKSANFFSLFPRFLLGCGFENIGVYEDYQEKPPAIDNFKNKIEHFKNEEYDIDVVFTHDKIMLIVRTEEKNRENLLSGIQSISSNS